MPAVNQVELHPYFPQEELRAYHDEHDIRTESWSPLAKRSELLQEDVITALAAEKGVTPAQVVLRWHVELEAVPIPKSADAARRRENLDVFSFTLDPRRSRRSRRSRAGGSGAATPTPTRSSDATPSRCSCSTPPPVTRRSGGLDSMLPMKPTLAVSVAAVAVCALLLVPATGATARPAVPDAVVTTDNETPVLYDDEEGGNASGDDPAIWVDPTDSEASIVITTAKEGGLRVYDLGSQELQSLPAVPAPRADGVDGRYNNVDIAYDVALGGASVDLAVVSDRYNDQLRFFTIDPAGAEASTPLTEVTASELPFLFSPDRATVDEEHTAYGLAVWQPAPGESYAVVTQEGASNLALVRLEASGGLVGYSDVATTAIPSTFPLPDGTTWVPCEEPGVGPQLEGVSVDQRTGVLYATQEDVGLWRIALPFGTRNRASSTG